MGQNVSDQVIAMLTKMGVKQIFGVPGDTIDSLMESLRIQHDIEFIIVRHEETAAFAASAQAKLTGKLAVCVACQGPGAIHLVNGLYDANLDRVPVLAITGQVDSHLIGTGMPQEIDQMKLMNDCTIFNEEVRSPENLPLLLSIACHAAMNKKGVAHLSIPADIMREKAIDMHERHFSYFESTIIPSEKELDAAALVLNQAKKIAILYGGGSREAASELLELSTLLNAPLVHTTRSKDIIDNGFENHVGGIGLLGSKGGMSALAQCDALLIVASCFAFREFYPQNIPIIQIDTVPDRIGAFASITHGLWGHAQVTLQALIKRLDAHSDQSFLKDIRHIHAIEVEKKPHIAKPTKDSQFIHPQTLTARVSELADENAIFCIGTGSVTTWANNFLKLNGKQRFLWSAHLASLGWALPATIGCQLAEPKKQVIGLVGDGEIQMLIGDFMTAVKYKLPIIYVLYNNSGYRFIEMEELGEGNPPFGTEFLNPDYKLLAEACGGFGITVNHYSDIDHALKAAFTSGKTAIVNVIVNPKEMFIPPKININMATSFIKATVKGWGF